MIALVAIAVSAVGWLSYRNLEQALLPRVLDRIETHSRQVATDLEYTRPARPAILRAFVPRGAAWIGARPQAAGSIRSTMSPKRPGATGSHRVSRPESGPSRPMRASHHRCRGRRPRNRPRRSLGTERHRSHRAGSGLQKRAIACYFRETIRLGRRQIYVSPLDLGRRNGVIEELRRPTICDRDADLRGRRQAVRHLHGQCRHAARVRPRPVIGAAGRERSMSSTDNGDYLVHPDRSPRIRRATRQAEQMEGRLPPSGCRGWGDGKAAPRSWRIRLHASMASRLRPRLLAGRMDCGDRDHPEHRLHGAGGASGTLRSWSV